MNEIHYLNLEYLRVLHSLLDTKSVTVSAQKLGVTQSAVSHSLKKLREHLQDELLFRQGNALELTAKAMAIREPLKRWLEQLGPILAVEDFDPKISKKIFTIATTDIIEHLFAPMVIKILQKEAPQVQLRFLRWEYEQIEARLQNSRIDLAIGVRSFDTPTVMQRVLYQESFISMVRKNHPIFKNAINLESFLSYPHIMTGPGDGKGAVDNYLEKLNRKRNLLYTVNSFSSAPALLENSDCILTAPKKFLEYLQKMHKVKTFQTPIKMSPFHLKIYWAKKNHNLEENKWLRQIFYQVAKTY